MNIAGLIFLLAAHYICGRGILRWFNLNINALQAACLSMMVGVPVISLVPCILQLLHVPIAALGVSIAIVIVTLGCSIGMLRSIKKPQIPRLKLPELYEAPFMIVIGALVLLSIWRCFYYPPFARDMLSGPELIAEYTVKEKTMVNSVFSLDLQSTNNYLKSPFITGLQIEYKLLVSSFGQLWLAVLSVSFIVYLYSLVKANAHPFVAGLLMFLFITVPDVYAYSYLMLYDYSNMVFFCCGFYFLMKHLQSGKMNELLFSALLLGFATYIRTETLVLDVMLVPLLLVQARKKTVKRTLTDTLVLIVVPALFYLLCNNVFIPSFVPVKFSVASDINPHLGDISLFFKRLADIHTRLIFSAAGKGSFGYFIWLFYVVIVADLVWIRRMTWEARVLLYGVAVVIVGLAVIGYLVPIADLGNTTKRGLFKAIPLMVLYLSQSRIIRLLGDKIVSVTMPAAKVHKEVA